MDDVVDTNSIAVAGIDIQSVASLEHPKRLAAFLNHFLTTTVIGLNKFSTQCVEKLDRMQFQLESIETQLQILEHKLATPQPIAPVAASSSGQASDQSAGNSSSTPVSTIED